MKKKWKIKNLTKWKLSVYISKLQKTSRTPPQPQKWAKKAQYEKLENQKTKKSRIYELTPKQNFGPHANFAKSPNKWAQKDSKN